MMEIKIVLTNDEVLSIDLTPKQFVDKLNNTQFLIIYDKDEWDIINTDRIVRVSEVEE